MFKVPAVFHLGSFSNFLACTGILWLVTPHQLAFCPPPGQIVIFIYQLIAMLSALSPPSQETHVKRMKTGRQFHPSVPPSHTPSSRSSVRPEHIILCSAGNTLPNLGGNFRVSFVSVILSHSEGIILTICCTAHEVKNNNPVISVSSWSISSKLCCWLRGVDILLIVLFFRVSSVLLSGLKYQCFTVFVSIL